jgi:N-acetylglucosamine kinase-like BadF-type ATPase
MRQIRAQRKTAAARAAACGKSISVTFFLGIDGGGTKTDCALGDSAGVLGRGREAGSKLARASEAQARAALHGAIRQAVAEAKVDLAQVRRTCVGMAGASSPEVIQAIRALVAEIVPGEIEVVGDMYVALEAAFPGAPGVVVIAGTGSIAYGRNERGETARAGGWGPAISDEGSGEWIGRAAAAAALRAYDSGHSTALIQCILNSWHLATRDEVARVANATPPPDYAALLPQILATAEAGDGTARDVLLQGGTELAQLAKVVVRRLWPGGEGAQVALAGGVFHHSALVRRVFSNSLRAERPQAEIVENVEPVLGALALARQAGQGSA